jgi:hypothetical protein
MLLVTGATGTIGSALVNVLLDRGAQVCCRVQFGQKPCPGVSAWLSTAGPDRPVVSHIEPSLGAHTIPTDFGGKTRRSVLPSRSPTRVGLATGAHWAKGPDHAHTCRGHGGDAAHPAARSVR